MHVLGLLNHALRDHRQITQSETPNSLLGSIKLWYILPPILHLVKRPKRLSSAERCDLTLLLPPYLMECTRQTLTRQSGQAREVTDANTLKRASSACHRPGGVTVVARSFLAEPRAPGSEETWERSKAKSPEEDQTSVSEAQQRKRWQATFSDPEEDSGPNWRPEEEFDSHDALEVFNSRNALTCAGSDDLRFSHLLVINNQDRLRAQKNRN